MEQKFCQCCAMPMNGAEDMYGTNADGSKSGDYCKYCFDKGAFTADISMEQMIEACVPHMVNGGSGMSADAARNMMKEVFPSLKRWNKA